MQYQAWNNSLAGIPWENLTVEIPPYNLQQFYEEWADSIQSWGELPTIDSPLVENWMPGLIEPEESEEWMPGLVEIGASEVILPEGMPPAEQIPLGEEELPLVLLVEVVDPVLETGSAPPEENP